jgi:hypothetical protein
MAHQPSNPPTLEPREILLNPHEFRIATDHLMLTSISDGRELPRPWRKVDLRVKFTKGRPTLCNTNHGGSSLAT